MNLKEEDCHLYLILPKKPESKYPTTERETKQTAFRVLMQKFTAKPDLAIPTCPWNNPVYVDRKHPVYEIYVRGLLGLGPRGKAWASSLETSKMH